MRREIPRLNAHKALNPAEQAEYISGYLVAKGVLPNAELNNNKKTFTLEKLTFSMRAVAALNKRYTEHESESRRLKELGKIKEAELEHQEAIKSGEAYWNTRKGKRLKKRIESPIYEAIRRIYKLAPLGVSKEEFLRQQMETADKSVMLVVNDTGSQGVERVSLLDESKRAINPVQFVKLLTRTDIRPELRFELWRKLFIGLVSAENASKSRRADTNGLLTTHTAYFGEDLFVGKELGETQMHTFTVLHDSETYAVRWVKGVHTNSEREQLAEKTVREETYSFRFRLLDGISKALSLPRDKDPESAVNKAIYKALTRDPNDSPYPLGEIVPEEDVRDNAAHKIAVFGARSINDQLMIDGKNMLINILTTRYEIDINNQMLMEKHFVFSEKGKKENSSPEHHFIKIKFNPPDSDATIEYQLLSIVDFLNDKYHIGEKEKKEITYNSTKKEIDEYNGRSEILLKHRQSRTLLPHYFQNAVYDPYHEQNLLDKLLEGNLEQQEIYAEQSLNSTNTRSSRRQNRAMGLVKF